MKINTHTKQKKKNLEVKESNNLINRTRNFTQNTAPKKKKLKIMGGLSNNGNKVYKLGRAHS